MTRLVITVLAVAALCMFSASAEEVDCKVFPKVKDPRSCCPLPEMVSPEVKKQCMEYLDDMTPEGASADEENEETTKPRPRPRPHPHHHCFMECVMNATGIMNNGEIDEAQANNYFADFLKDTPEIIPVIDESFKTCAAKEAEMRAKFAQKMERRPPPPDGKHCSPYSGMIMGCVFRHTMKNCPESIRSNSDECQQLRAFITSCKPPHGRHGA